MNSLITQYKGLRKENYILFFGRIVTNLGSMVWPMLTLILNQKLGMNASDTAVIMVIAGIAYLPANVIAGKMADLFNKKRIIICCDLASITCLIICGIMPLSRLSVIPMVLSGIFQGMEDPAYNALLADITPTEKRESAYSLLYLGANIGLVLSPTLAGFLFRNFLWLSFFINAAAIGSSTLLIFIKLQNIEPVEETSAASEYQVAREGTGLFTILKENPVLILYLFLVGLYYAAYQQYGYLMPLDLGRVHGENGAVIFGTVSSVNCIIVVIFTPLITRLFQRVSETGKTLVGDLLQIAGYGVFALMIGHIPAYYMAMFLFTWGEIFATIAIGPFLSKRIPASHRGRINGVEAMMTMAFTSVGELVIGRLFDLHGSGAAWGLTQGVGAVTVVLCILLMIADKKRYPKLYMK